MFRAASPRASRVVRRAPPHWAQHLSARTHIHIAKQNIQKGAHARTSQHVRYVLLCRCGRRRHGCRCRRAKEQQCEAQHNADERASKSHSASHSSESSRFHSPCKRKLTLWSCERVEPWFDVVERKKLLLWSSLARWANKTTASIQAHTHMSIRGTRLQRSGGANGVAAVSSPSVLELARHRHVPT